ncbi:MAG: PEP-CTERM sorting domain-containing protein [Limisphaerales bacterium]
MDGMLDGISGVAIVMAAMTGIGQAQLFFQDFSSSGVVSDYVSTTPNNGQFNAIGSSGAGTTVSITGSALQYTRGSANTGSFSRTSDFSPVPTTLRYQFDLGVSGNTAAQTTAAVWQVGSGFGTANSAEANSAVYARFAVNFTATAGQFQLRDVSSSANSANFSGTQTISWFLNNSGSTISYTAPDNSTESLANNTADIWAGTTRAFNNVAVLTASQSMADMKFAFSQGSGTITMDNFSVAPLTAVPEPEAYTLVTAGALLAFAAWRRRARASVARLPRRP